MTGADSSEVTYQGSVGDARDALEVIDFRNFDGVEDIVLKFDSGEYRIEISDGEPELVEVDDA